MPLLSMTGFGKGAGTLRGRPLSVEIRTVNGKMLELSIRSPREFSGVEGKIRQRLQERLNRGTVQCFVAWGGGNNGERPAASSVDLAQARRYVEMGERLRQGCDLPVQGWSLQELITLPGVLIAEESLGDDEELWSELEPVIEEAIAQTVAHRNAEGENLQKELLYRVDRLGGLLDQVEVLLPERLSGVQQRLRDRVGELLGDQPLDEQRMHQEIALLVDKLDITEEIVRFRSHNALFVETVTQPGPHGRRLGFLLQEMGREANTLGTKSQHADMQHIAIALKEELEILREQALNIE